MTSTDENTNSPPAPCAENHADIPESRPLTRSLSTGQLKALARYTDPCSHNDDREQVLKGLYHETDGSDEGLAIADEWYSHADDYPGSDEVARKWQSIEHSTDNPVTVSTLCDMVEANGFDWMDICSSTEPDFVTCEYKVIRQGEQAPILPAELDSPLARYSLKGKLQELEKEAVDQVPILGDLALMGQSTVFYAAPNTGKTLLTLSLLIAATESGKADPLKVYYVNVDDSLSGVIDKLRLSDKYYFHMIAEGHSDFRADDLLGILTDMISNDQCKGVVIILDTLKKFTNIMHKRKSTGFGKIIRRFVMRGGTCISLAHTNKKLGNDGKPVYAGTSDIIEDADCAYTLQAISDADSHTKVVAFENIKRRGNVCQSAAYSYSTENDISYSELLLTIRPVDDTELVALQQSDEFRADAEPIDVVVSCIREGINSKMKLADTVAERSGSSKRAAHRLIEKYAGTDPAMHKWTYTVQGRGAKVFSLLAPDTAVSDLAGKP